MQKAEVTHEPKDYSLSSTSIIEDALMFKSTEEWDGHFHAL